MGSKDLIPITTHAQAVELGRKGGSVSSPAKKLAARMRELRKKGLTDDSVKQIVDIMEDPEASSLHIFTYLQNIKASAKTNVEKGRAARLLIEWQKMHHGLKVKSENTNLNINMDYQVQVNIPKEVEILIKEEEERQIGKSPK